MGVFRSISTFFLFVLERIWLRLVLNPIDFRWRKRLLSYYLSYEKWLSAEHLIVCVCVFCASVSGHKYVLVHADRISLRATIRLIIVGHSIYHPYWTRLCVCVFVYVHHLHCRYKYKNYNAAVL